MHFTSTDIVKSFRVAMAAVVVLTLSTFAGAAELRFARSLSDSAVLQRDAPVTVQGFAGAGAKITVTFAGQSKQATADPSGKWAVELAPMPANAEGQPLTCKADGESVTLQNIVVGDVILFARQTFIDVSLGRDDQGKAAASKLPANTGLRIMRIKTLPAVEPQADLAPQATDGWAVAGKQNVAAMSAAAFYLGRDLSAEVDVPIGIIDLNMGPNFTIGWLDRQTIADMEAFTGQRSHTTGYAESMEEQLERFKTQEGKERDPKDNKWVEEHPVKDPMYPSAGYNATLHPMRGMSLKAIVLQLGNDYPYMGYEQLRKEGRSFDRKALDAAWWQNYLHRKRGYRAGMEVIPRVPAVWRAYFDSRQLPIGLVMPPGTDNPTYAIHNREVRDLQHLTARANPGVGLIMPGVEHVPFSGQPADEPLLAERSLAWLLASVYGKEGAPSGPLFDRMETNYAKAQVFFKAGTAEGLRAKPGALDHFEVAGLDKVFYPAVARIDGNTIRLTSEAVSRIADVRYNYRGKPDQGMTNSAGLPAIPFRTGEHKYIDVPRSGEQNLPREYTTPANEWEGGDVAIVSGGGARYPYGPGWVGATGMHVLPFGPNMRVTAVLAGSPADGRIEVDDMIYKVNGELLEEDHLHHLGRAIALAESEAGGGKIAFSLRRGNELLEVNLQVEVLGTYSATSPYDCPKADRIIANSEAYLAKRGGLASGYAGGGWLHADVLFLLAAGTPEHQGLVRRFIYRKMAEIDEKGVPGGNAWHRGHGTLLFAEYYLATGDRNVLPYLKAYCDVTAAMQCRPGTFPEMPPRSVGGWRHNYPGGQWYGMIPVIGLPAMIGMNLAKEAGVEVDSAAYDRGLHMFRDHQAEMGKLTYSAVMPKYTRPDPLDPDKLAVGRLYPGNGSKAMAAILFDLEGDTRIAHLNSMYCAYAYNNTHEGHGSNYFNGMWTPLGANLHSKPAFIHFMANHYWYRDLNRMFNHASLPGGNHAASAGHDLALVAPRQRLRILGAPASVFGANAAEFAKPALEAFFARDYPLAEKLISEQLASGELLIEDRTRAEQLRRAAVEMQASIASDLAAVERLLSEGKFYEARLDVPQLKGVLPAGDARLATIEARLASVDEKVMREDKSRYGSLQKRLEFRFSSKSGDPDNEAGWQAVTTTVFLGRGNTMPLGLTTEEDATRWRVKIVEAVNRAPEGWNQPDFDVGDWGTTTLPISWHLNHGFLARTLFDVKDVKSIDALRVACHPFRQLNINVYLNGHVVAKFNECENNGGWVYGELPPGALKHLRNGRNTLAFSTTHDWRWSSRGGVRNSGFGLRLDMK